MARNVREEVYVVVAPAIGPVVTALAVVLGIAVVVAVAVSCMHFSDGTGSTQVSTTSGACASFCPFPETEPTGGVR